MQQRILNQQNLHHYIHKNKAILTVKTKNLVKHEPSSKSFARKKKVVLIVLDQKKTILAFKMKKEFIFTVLGQIKPNLAVRSKKKAILIDSGKNKPQNG